MSNNGSVARGVVGFLMYGFLAGIWGIVGLAASGAAIGAVVDPKKPPVWIPITAGAVGLTFSLLALLFVYFAVRGLLKHTAPPRRQPRRGEAADTPAEGRGGWEDRR